ncbi:uncharacterized protein LOC132207622 [Stegostoma tigrinum]|uniref:uncharacterized protein LOC132207622 n=1 Tax=Stegostoma tigrinum TaxID=3053191 RepID=UPI0028703A6F|nr:uncharacterized protein LOC132207622 [Stegostoma tigrinum]
MTPAVFYPPQDPQTEHPVPLSFTGHQKSQVQATHGPRPPTRGFLRLQNPESVPAPPPLTMKTRPETPPMTSHPPPPAAPLPEPLLHSTPPLPVGESTRGKETKARSAFG